MVARTQKKGETMKLIKVLRPGGGLEEAERFIAKLVASSLYLAFSHCVNLALPITKKVQFVHLSSILHDLLCMFLKPYL